MDFTPGTTLAAPVKFFKASAKWDVEISAIKDSDISSSDENFSNTDLGEIFILLDIFI
jgi:hypothetical protein